MIKFYNNIENEEKFLAIVECLKKAENIEYEGYDVSDPLDEMNDFMDSIGLLDDLNISFWFNEIYGRWMYDCCSSLSVETITKSFDEAVNGKHYYDVGNFLEEWDKGLVEYVLEKEEEFTIINDRKEYENFFNKYKVTIKVPSGYYMEELDLWQPFCDVEEDAAYLLKETVLIDFEEDDNIDIEQVSKDYAGSFLMEVEYKNVVIEK